VLHDDDGMKSLREIVIYLSLLYDDGMILLLEKQVTTTY
jgi:hypothetical protein